MKHQLKTSLSAFAPSAFCFYAFALLAIVFTISCTKPPVDEPPVDEPLLPGESEMILVEGGTFAMGCSDGECYNWELPQHQVTVSNFKIAKYPVTQKQWNEIMGSNPSSFKGDDLPVETVNWQDIQDFIGKLNAATGKKYRLPTEAEWEYACRGGAKSAQYKYSGGNDIDVVAWHSGNSEGKTHAVGAKTPNELGICDMSGNVWELCSDWYAAYSASAQTNPQGPSSGTLHVTRGGSWGNEAQRCRVSNRGTVSPEDGHSGVGFRLVLP